MVPGSSPGVPGTVYLVPGMYIMRTHDPVFASTDRMVMAFCTPLLSVSVPHSFFCFLQVSVGKTLSVVEMLACPTRATTEFYRTPNKKQGNKKARLRFPKQSERRQAGPPLQNKKGPRRTPLGRSPDAFGSCCCPKMSGDGTFTP